MSATLAPVVHVSPLPATEFNARMARGHRERMGHTLDAVTVSADGMLWHMVRTCCGAPIPATVETWAGTVPARPDLSQFAGYSTPGVAL